MGKKVYIIFLACILLAGCGTLDSQIETREVVSNKKVMMSYYKDQLTVTELKAYEKIVENIEQMDTGDIVLEEPISDYELLRLIEAITVGRPDLFYVYSIGGLELGAVINPYDGELIAECKNSEKVSKINIEYVWESKEEIEEAIKELDKEVNRIIQRVVSGENLITAERYLKDEILSTTRTDAEFINKYSGKAMGDTEKKDFLSMKAYGALVQGKAVCGGFTSAYNLLLNEIGIEATGVVVLLNGTTHSSNIVKINDRYVVVDLSNSLYHVFNKEFKQLTKNGNKYMLYSLFEHDLE